MTINLKAPELRELKPRIMVCGVGGAGGNAVNNMILSGLSGVDFIVANTDAQALSSSKADRIIQMGLAVTEGLGAGSQPEVGRAAAEEALEEIRDHLAGAHMVFVTAGMGGGTGTGAAPIISRAARDLGILTVGVVTKPFQFEGPRRMRIAENGINELQKAVDTLIVIPNQNLFRVANERTTFADAFAMADQVLYSGVACITDLMVKEGLINLDFADVRAIMREMGKAMMGTGEATGEKRAVQAAEAAIANPLLDEVSMRGAQGLLISITGGNDLTLYEVDEAASRIRQEVDEDANIILGATFDENLEGLIRVSVVATGIDQPLEGREYMLTEQRIEEVAQKLRVQVASRHLEVAPRNHMPGSETGELILAGPHFLHGSEGPGNINHHANVAHPSTPVHGPKLLYPSGSSRNPTEDSRNFLLGEGAGDSASPPKNSSSNLPLREAGGGHISPSMSLGVRPARMPRVEDLPIPAQNQIRAKRGEPLVGAGGNGMGVESKRRSLLDRLTSFGTRQEHFPPARPSDPSLQGSGAEGASLNRSKEVAQGAIPAAYWQPSPVSAVTGGGVGEYEPLVRKTLSSERPPAGPSKSLPPIGELDGEERRPAREKSENVSSEVSPLSTSASSPRSLLEEQLDIPAFLRRQSSPS